MKNKKAQIAVALIAVAVLVFFLLQNGDGEDMMEEVPPYKELQVKRGTFEVMVSATGEVKPIDRVEVKSKASGQIVELAVEQGDLAKKGDLIARLDQKDEKADVDQAQANLDIAKAELKQARLNYDRRGQLFEKGLVSEEDLGEIELALATAKGKLVQAKTALDRATERLSEAIVRAPIDGVILQKYVEEGQIIASGVSNVSGGTPIVDIADMNSVYIEAGIDEIDIGKIRAGQLAEVSAEAYPGASFRGNIIRLAPEARLEQNVTLFDVVIKVENQEGKLKSGMNANVEITIIHEEDVLLVPAMALQRPGSGMQPGSFPAGGMSRGDSPGAEPQGNGSAGRFPGRNPSRQTDGAANGAQGRMGMVLIKKGDEFVPQRIEIGSTSFRDAVVLSGLEEGDIVGVPMISRTKMENDRREQMFRSSRTFGASGESQNQSERPGTQGSN